MIVLLIEIKGESVYSAEYFLETLCAVLRMKEGQLSLKTKATLLELYARAA